MEKGKEGSRKERIYRILGVIFAAILILPTVVFADEGPATSGGGATGGNGGGGGFFSRIGDSLSNLTSGLPSIFQELSPADVGHKPRVKPHFAFNQGFHSNARLGGNQKDAAWQARVAPGITVSIPSGKLYSEVDYTYGFSTTQGRKTNANINTHNVSALARYDLTADTTLGVANNIQLSEVPGSGGDTFILETATAQVTHRISPKLTASAWDTFQWFKDQTETETSPFVAKDKYNNEFVDNGVGVSLGYDATSDLKVGPSFTWNIRNFDENQDKDYWQITPGVNGSYRLGPKTTVNGNFGWAFRRFDRRGGTTTGRTESELVYGAGFNHKLGRRFIWSVQYAKTIQDTFDTSFVNRDTPEVTALDNLDRDFRVIKSHRVGGSATYNLNEKNSVSAFGDVQFLFAEDDDNTITRRENREKAMEVGARYTYRFNRYITFDVLYAFGRRFERENRPPQPGVGREDYTFHKVSGGVNITV